MDPSDFEVIAKLVHQQSGIVLTSNKAYLVENRLQAVKREHNLTDTAALVRRLQDGDKALADDVTDAMTTNETSFFRNRAFFETLGTQALPYLCERRAAKKELKIWCAGVATGQEAYSVAMVLEEHAAELIGWSIRILATDLSRTSLQAAQSGMFSQFDVQRGLRARQLITHFDKDGENWRIKPALQKNIEFDHHNLIDPQYSLGGYDLILCRNVLYYFDQPTKVAVLDRLSRHVPDDGLLVLGSEETVSGVSKAFRPVRTADGYFTPSRSNENVDALMDVTALKRAKK